MRYLRTNTATRITVGPFLDKTDGITPEVALTVTSEKLTLVVDTGGVPTLVLDVAPTASGGANDMIHITGDDSGFYDLELAAADVNYLGRAMLSLNDVATHCPVFHEFMILPAVIYDAMVLGTDLFDVSATQLSGQTITAAAGVTFPTSVASPTNITAATGVVLSGVTHTGAVIPTVTTLTGHTAQTGDTYALANGANGFVALKGDTAAILIDTAVIGAAGAGLTAIPWNATWDAEVESEAYDALNTAFTDATSLTANGLLDRLRIYGWINRNKMAVTNANGNTTIFKDDSTTAAFTVTGLLVDDSTTTTRLRVA